MSEVFSKSEFNRIRNELRANPATYGLPQRVDGSVVLASFNIREFGSVKKAGTGRDENSMAFLAYVCRHFDLVAVQEVLRNVQGVHRLRELMGPEYKIVVSDTTGSLPGKGDAERLAYIYREPIVSRTEMVTDVTFDRSIVMKRLALYLPEIKRAFDETRYVQEQVAPYRQQLDKFAADLEEYAKALRQWRADRAAGRRTKKPKRPKEPKEPSVKHLKPKMPTFLSFIRTPFAVSFRVRGGGSESYDFLAVNAHLHFGEREEDRQMENEALMEWILAKVRAVDQNVVLFGDLNFDLDKPEEDLVRIVKKFRRLGGLVQRQPIHASFPFLFRHPRPKQTSPPVSAAVAADPARLKKHGFRTNVGLTQTFDQIGVLSRDKRLGGRMATSPEGHSPVEVWGRAPEGPDYGVVNLTELFSHVLNGKSFYELKSKEKTAFKRRYHFSVSDHMPIWLRVPLPGQA